MKLLIDLVAVVIVGVFLACVVGLLITNPFARFYGGTVFVGLSLMWATDRTLTFFFGE